MGGARATRSAALLAAALLAVSVTVSVSPAATLAASTNVSATHALIAAGHVLGSESEARMGAMRRAIRASKGRLLRQCAHIARESPQDEQSYKLSYEAAGALWAAGYGADRGPIVKFARATRGLRWSSAKINRDFKAFVEGLQGLSTLRTPSLCKDIAAWKASGYAHLPSETVSFDARVEALEAKAVPSRLLAPYAQGSDRALLRQDERMDTKLLDFETEVGGDAWYALTEGLELNP